MQCMFTIHEPNLTYCSTLIVLFVNSYRWVKHLNDATQAACSMEGWIDVSSHNVSLPALLIKNPDCYGYLFKTGNRNKNWKRRYAVLKDGCLYYYCDMDSASAQGAVRHDEGQPFELISY